MDLTTLVGFFAAICTSISYFPQLKKCWDTGKTDDLSFLMFGTLATGVATWVVYGLLKRDIVIIIANGRELLLPRRNIVVQGQRETAGRLSRPMAISHPERHGGDDDDAVLIEKRS